MKKIVYASLLLCCALLATAVAAQAQTQDRDVTNGSVCRIIELRFKPGANNERNFMKFLREHRVPIFTEQKQQGLIVDFKFFHNDTTRGPNETELVQSVCFRSYNDALDPGSNEERSNKLRDITVKHYGSIENMRKTIELTEDWVEVKRAFVLHEMTFNPPKPAASGN